VQATEQEVAGDLSRDLQRYSDNQRSQASDDHLLQLCKTAARIRRMMRQQRPSSWDFDWDGGPRVQFPRVMKDGKEVMEAEYD